MKLAMQLTMKTIFAPNARAHRSMVTAPDVHALLNSFLLLAIYVMVMAAILFVALFLQPGILALQVPPSMKISSASV